MAEQVYKSSCCSAPVRTNIERMGYPDRLKMAGVQKTQYYVCDKCACACNIVIDRTTFKK